MDLRLRDEGRVRELEKEVEDLTRQIEHVAGCRDGG